MEVKVYRNKQNSHKYIITKKDNSRHYYWRQEMCFDNGVTNPVGTKKGGFMRQGKKTIEEVLEDYKELDVVWNVVGKINDRYCLVSACSTIYERAKERARKARQEEEWKEYVDIKPDWNEKESCWWL